MEVKYKVNNKMKGFGDYDEKKKLIRINKKRSKKHAKGEYLDTLEHESLHVKHPKLSERKITKKTTESIKRMDKRSKAKLYAKTRTK